MKEQLISLETAKLAKEKGFDWRCNQQYRPNGSLQNLVGIFSYHPNEYWFNAPTQSLLTKWLRERKVHIDVFLGNDWNNWYFMVETEGATTPVRAPKHSVSSYLTYEDALEAGLIEALKLIK